jgi:integrase
MKSRAEVLKSVQKKIRLLHFAYSTEQSYCHWAGRYYDFCLRLPRTWPAERKAEAFLTDLALRQGVAARTQNQALAALLFLYHDVMRKPLGDVDALRAKRPVHERTSPSREQVRALRLAVHDRPNFPARLLVDLLYGCGLRVSEPLELRVKDVLWSENQLVIRAAKGGKDRRVPIPACCADPLRAQIASARQVWESDRKNSPTIGVSLPHQLARKYPSAPRAWQWFWVFPAAGHCAHPRTGETVRYHLLHDLLQRAVREAAIKTGLEGLITPHVLRHAYATHSREPIETLRELMGHVSIETTAGYRHPVASEASNPLDDLLGG